MTPRSWLVVLVAVVAGLLVGGAPAGARSGYGRVSLDRWAYTAHENQGYLRITLRRTDTNGDEWVRYGVRQHTAENGKDFVAIPNSLAHFADGEDTTSFRVRIIDRGMSAPPVYATVYTYGSYPAKLVSPHQAEITILRDDPLDARDPANPLGAPGEPATGNPLAGVRFFIPGWDSPAGAAAAHIARSNPGWAQALNLVANEPIAKRWWMWNTPGDPSGPVSRVLEDEEARQPGSVIQLADYSLVHGRCTGNWSDSPGLVRHYQRWIDGLARGIGNFKVAFFLEIDSLITTGCLSHHGYQVRIGELNYAINRLEAQPHVVVYIDGGAADATDWRQMARMLDEAGVHNAQGFFLNSTHFDWTTNEIAYGQKIARSLGGVHFVVATHQNGRGPLVPANRVRDGNEVLCNPAGRGMGPLSTQTGYKWVDGFLWFMGVAGSGGKCVPGAPALGKFWPAYAVMLVRNAVFCVTGPRHRLARSGQPYMPYDPRLGCRR